MPSLQLRLPAMMMRVDEPGRDDLIGTVNDFGITRRLDIRCNLRDLVALDQNRCLRWNNMIIRVVNKSGAVFQENRCHLAL